MSERNAPPYQYEYELAKMARASYFTPGEIEESMELQSEKDRLLPDGWGILPKAFEDTNARTGFVAHAFVNQKRNEIVIAYRGSEPTGETAHGLIDYKGANAASARDGDVRAATGSLLLGAAAQTLMRQRAPDWHAQFEQGLDFAERVLEQSKTLPGGPYTVHVTGHSLGGSVAQVTHQMFDLPGRTFDPGGAANLTFSDEFRAWRSQYYLHRDDGIRERDPDSQGFSNYRVNDSVVSRRSGSHVGAVEDVTGYGGRETWRDKAPYYLNRLGGQVGAIGAAFDTIELHDMDRIIRVFDEARQTGELNRVGTLMPERDLDRQASSLAGARRSSSGIDSEALFERAATAALRGDRDGVLAVGGDYLRSDAGQAWMQQGRDHNEAVKVQEQQAALEREQQLLAQQQAQQLAEQMEAPARRGPVMRL